MRYPPEFIDKVQESSSLLDIISQYTQLKPSGGGYMGRCPFPDHQEKTASFSMSEAKQVYHCFGCKKSGNIFTFLRDFNGMNFPEAVEYLADRAGVPIPENVYEKNNQQPHSGDKKKQILKLNKVASDFFQETLKRVSSDHLIKSYIQKRRLKTETIEEFKIGFSPSEWDRLTTYFQKHNFDLHLAEEAKLIKAKKEGHSYFDLFRDRLMFPILSASGEVLAFGGRIYDQGEPKYLNSPETLVFSKSKVLYGLAQTAKYIRTEDCVLIVEGYMDLVSLYQSGIRNVAATMGTALTPEHAKLIKRMTNNVVVLFDGDEAGQIAAERSLSILLSGGLYPRGLVLTEAKDPDEFVNKLGAEELTKKIQKSSDLFNVVLQSWTVDYRGEASQKVKLVDKIKPIFDAISDQRLKMLYVDDLISKMDVTKEWLRSALSSNSGQKIAPNNAYRQGHVEPSVQNFQSSNVMADESESSKNKINLDSEDPRFSIFKDLELPIKIADASQVELMLIQMGLKSRANFQWLLNYNENKMSSGVLDTENQSLKTEDNSGYGYKQLLSQINHLGIRKILQLAEQVYRQDQSKFDKFFTLLINKIDQPDKLFHSFNFGIVADASQNLEYDYEKEQKYMSDLIKKIQQNFLRAQSKDMVRQIKTDIKSDKTNLDVDKLKEFIEIQKNRLSLKK